MKKITLNEFWNSKKFIAIHCSSKEKAKKLLGAFESLGKKWCDGESYLNETNWDDYYEDTCYSNLNGYSGVCFYCEMGFDIYEFDDVILFN